jgi:uncharacterized protein (DUF2164 family)
MSYGPMQIKLDDEQQQRIVGALQTFFDRDLDQSVSEFQAKQILDFFVKELGAPVYNQAIRDARKFFQEKLDDLEGEFYEPEDS